MKMWDYAYAWGRNGTVYKALKGSSPPRDVKEYITELGRDGWELCGVLPERDGYMLIFKREARD